MATYASRLKGAQRARRKVLEQIAIIEERKKLKKERERLAKLKMEVLTK